MIAPAFPTHSVALKQRILFLAVNEVQKNANLQNYNLEGEAPAIGALAPPGYCQLFVVHEGFQVVVAVCLKN